METLTTIDRWLDTTTLPLTAAADDPVAAVPQAGEDNSGSEGRHIATLFHLPMVASWNGVERTLHNGVNGRDASHIHIHTASACSETRNAERQLHLLGVSFRTAPVAVRESLSFDATEAAVLLRRAATEFPDREALLLSTCNRTEFYLAAPPNSRAVEDWLTLLRQARPGAQILHSECQRYQKHGAEAARHLLSVACGLDSAILGDAQILGQVKQAMSLAASCGTLGATLQETLVRAIKAGKRSRRETRIGSGAVSLGSVIAGLIAERETSGVPSRVLILGAGEIARDIGRHVAKGGRRELTFVNRTHEKAEALAAHCGGRALTWESFPTALAESDFLIAATACPRPIVSRAVLDSVAARRSRLLVIDAGVPRNVENGSPVEVMNIDAIRERRETALAQRLAAVPDVARIVEEELAAWTQWCKERSVEDLLKTLFQQAGVVSRTAAEELGAVGAEPLIHRAIKRLLYSHARRLRTLASAAQPMPTTSTCNPPSTSNAQPSQYFHLQHNLKNHNKK